MLLEVCGKAVEALLNSGRTQPINYFRSLSFDWRVNVCKVKNTICRQCCQVGQRYRVYTNIAHFRSCDFTRLSTGHLMISTASSEYNKIGVRAASCY